MHTIFTLNWRFWFYVTRLFWFFYNFDQTTKDLLIYKIPDAVKNSEKYIKNIVIKVIGVIH